MAVSSNMSTPTIIPAASPRKGTSGFVVELDAAAPQAVNFKTPVDGVSVTNSSAFPVRATVTFNAGITPSGDNTFIVPPNGSAAIDLHDEDFAGTGIDSIDGVELVVVALGGPNTVTNAAALVAAVGRATVYLNAVES